MRYQMTPLQTSVIQRLRAKDCPHLADMFESSWVRGESLPMRTTEVPQRLHGQLIPDIKRANQEAPLLKAEL